MLHVGGLIASAFIKPITHPYCHYGKDTMTLVNNQLDKFVDIFNKDHAIMPIRSLAKH